MALKTQNDWRNPKDITQGQCLEQLFVGYHPAYGFMIMDWRTGHGWRDIQREIYVYPEKVAFLCVPEGNENCKN